jgi:predicted AAA+ superfamily ATPase
MDIYQSQEKLYIQVCYLLAGEGTIERKFHPLLNIPDAYPKLVLSLDRELGSDYNGIKRLHVEDWLMQEKT